LRVLLLSGILLKDRLVRDTVSKNLSALDSCHDGHDAYLAFHVVPDAGTPYDIGVRVKFVGKRGGDLLGILQGQVTSTSDVDQASGCSAVVDVKHRVAQAFPDNALRLEIGRASCRERVKTH